MRVNGYNKEVHHIRKLADIAQKPGKDQPEWMQNMLARRRKTLVVCLECHKKIHSGRYDSQAIKRSYAFEPDETEIAHVRFGGGLLEKRLKKTQLAGFLPYVTYGSPRAVGEGDLLG